jgi:phosphatidylserine/phosphatidylglycerophosphate/cardiolipin synthase-like enzyme
LRDVTDQSAQARVLAPGRNCWRIAPARRAAVLIDTCDYFSRLAEALRRAERSVLIIAWVFDGRIKLCPQHDDCLSLGELLRSRVEARPELEVRILVWSAAVVHASNDPISLLIGADWQKHPRISVRLDRKHPLYGSHHQKIVAIDDALAFCGGIDLTTERWDTCGHDEGDPLRLTPDGKSYEPVHDVQMAVDGDAARAVADVARDRWRIATGEVLAPVDSESDPWPEDLAPDFTDTPVAVARTSPAYGGAEAVHEIAALTDDLLAAARDSIYIETQYLASSKVRRFLTKSLAAKRGPEVVVVVRRASPGLLEELVMGRNRDRLIRHLRHADRHNRLRIYFPVVPGKETACEVLVHAKVVVVDDTILRIGSSNLNNRSMGLDTECDLAIEATSQEQRGAIARVRDTLLAEHLGIAPEEVTKAINERGSLIRGIEACNRGTRGLRPFPETDFHGPTEPITGTGLLDPKRPFALP